MHLSKRNSRNPKCDGYQRELSSINFLIKKSSGGAVTHANKFAIKSEINN